MLWNRLFSIDVGPVTLAGQARSSGHLSALIPTSVNAGARSEQVNGVADQMLPGWLKSGSEASFTTASGRLTVVRCHWYTMPFSPQAYRLASLVVTMALELGINERPSEMTQHQVIVQSSSLSGPSRLGSEHSWSHEIGRAYVGAATVSM